MFESFYKGHKRFDREQLVFVVDAILNGALDVIESGLPHSCIKWEDRIKMTDGFPQTLSYYERGAMESTGMSLAVLYAHLNPGDGLGTYDALSCANNFDFRCNKLIEKAWEDKGEKIRKEYDRLIADGNFQIERDLYDVVIPGYFPNTRRHAVVFVDEVFHDYLNQ